MTIEASQWDFMINLLPTRFASTKGYIEKTNEQKIRNHVYILDDKLSTFPIVKRIIICTSTVTGHGVVKWNGKITRRP